MATNNVAAVADPRDGICALARRLANTPVYPERSDLRYTLAERAVFMSECCDAVLSRPALLWYAGALHGAVRVNAGRVRLAAQRSGGHLMRRLADLTPSLDDEDELVRTERVVSSVERRDILGLPVDHALLTSDFPRLAHLRPFDARVAFMNRFEALWGCSALVWDHHLRLRWALE